MSQKSVSVEVDVLPPTGVARPPSEPVLSIEGLRTQFDTRDGIVRAVDGFSCLLGRGEILGLVGESGCGKSVTALSVLGLIPRPPGRFAGGAIRFEGRDLLRLSEKEMRKVRGKEISMVFQEPMTSLNPVLTIGRQIAETIVLHQQRSKGAALNRAAEMLDLVRIADPGRCLKQYPHELSGGMRQRVMIAMALACNPSILIADEPTTALDVTIQAQILALMVDLKERLGTAILLITHNLGVVAETAERVVVMYAGRKVEEAPVEDLFGNPFHPYTVGLLGSVPRLGRSVLDNGPPSRLTEIPGMVPSLIEPFSGCSFSPRCSFSTETCRREDPPLEEKAPNHTAACWHSDELHHG